MLHQVGNCNASFEKSYLHKCSALLRMSNLINSVPGGSPATSANLSRPGSLAELEEPPTKVPPKSSVDLRQPADNTAIQSVSSAVKNSTASVASLDKSSQSSKSNASTELPSIFSNTVSRCKHTSLSLILKELIYKHYGMPRD